MHIEDNEQGAVASASENAEPATSIEWAQNVQTIELSEEALAKVLELIEAPPRRGGCAPPLGGKAPASGATVETRNLGN